MPPASTGHGVYLLNPLMGLVWLLTGLLIAFYVYSDSSKRYPRGSLAPLIWTAGVVFGGLPVLLLYLLVRPPERRD